MSNESGEDINARYPRTVEVGPSTVELRLMAASDEAAVLEFAGTLPRHDLLFLQRDISAAPVMAAWVREIEAGHTPSLIAVFPLLFFLAQQVVWPWFDELFIS